MRIPSWILSVRTKCHNLTRPLARPPNIPCRVCDLPTAGLNFVNQLLRISSLELRSILLMIVRVPTSIFSKNGYDMEQCSFLPMMRMFWQLIVSLFGAIRLMKNMIHQIQKSGKDAPNWRAHMHNLMRILSTCVWYGTFI